MFTPEFFEFYQVLAKNNNRDWFNEHKPKYLQAVVQPMCAFIDEMAPRLRKISPHFVADSRPHGGSMFRIYRDVRFSKDKSPYKLHAACQFRHELGKDAHTVGFYVHISAGEAVFGGGIWMPPSGELLKIRNTIVDNPNEWRRIKSSRSVKKFFGGIGGDGLKRPPRGFDADHEHIEDLKRKSFFLMRREPPEIILDDGFVSEVDKTFRAAKPLMEYICYAQDIEI
ncbi:MAG: DUF2461 domain-containing protein [Gammaproteobacteria bacterium]|nr:DUF2461 domain-containing protein [Gammaproteobacteria bacterium]